MKLNWAEMLAVNNPLRVLEQQWQMRWFKKTMRLRPGARILEVGCGRGAGARLIMKAFQPGEIYCQDLDPRMIQKACQYLRPWERKRACFQVGDAATLFYADNVMDAVFDFGIIHHVPDWRKAVSEIARVLKPGGYFYVEELYPGLYQNFITKHLLAHPTHDRFKSRDFRTALAESGLSIQAAKENRLLGILAVAVKN